jgi:hypothetical protein
MKCINLPSNRMKTFPLQEERDKFKKIEPKGGGKSKYEQHWLVMFLGSFVVDSLLKNIVGIVM